MPCETFPGEAAAWDRRARIFKLHNYVAEKVGNPVRYDLQVDYGIPQERVHEQLCNMMRALSDQRRDEITYDARSKDSRDLADWWEYHQEKDRQHEEERRRVEKNAELRRSAAAKLTDEEREALGMRKEKP